MFSRLKNKIKNQIFSRMETILKKMAAKHGYFLLKNHYYSPIPDPSDIPLNYWQTQSELVGLEINEQKIQSLLSELDPYITEFRESVPNFQTGDETLFLINGSFMAVDAHIYYSFIRYFKPKKIIEIGSGRSTLFAAKANQINEGIEAIKPYLIALDPYPPEYLNNNAHISEIIPQKLQEIDVTFFANLQKNDILFIDSTHVLRTGNDVQMEYCEILPRLAPGVLVHIHDISLPKHYPRVYFDNELYWNEQYLLQAFLAFNSKFEILWPGNYMMIKYPEILAKIFPEFQVMRQHFPMSEPTSFWLRVKS